MLEKILFTAEAISHGGRNGRMETSDGVVAVALSMPKEVGGPGIAGHTTPEHLFAGGYAACFGSAVELIAQQHEAKLDDISIRSHVSIGPLAAGGYGLAVKLKASLPGVDRETAERIVAEAHAVCPYSNAIKGNVPVEISVEV